MKKHGLTGCSFSLEHRAKLKLAQKGKNLGKIRSLLTRQKVSKGVLKYNREHPESLIKRSQQFKGRVNFWMTGSNSWFWKGGITELDNLICSLPEYTNWRTTCLIRDDCTCMVCKKHQGGKEKIKIQVHHIKPFAILLREFLQNYNQFSPIDDKEVLLRLAITWKPFWEVSNGKTLCKKCHELVKDITHKLIKLYNKH